MDEFSCIKASISINKPLKTRLALPIQDDPNHQVLYVNLSRFCLFCEVIGHKESGYMWLSDVETTFKNSELLEAE